MVLTQRKIETENDRFGGFSTTLNTNRSYFADNVVDEIEIPTTTEKVVERPIDRPFRNYANENDNLFEVEKEYNNIKSVYESPTKSAQEMPEFTITSETKEQPVVAKTTKLSTRGKIILSVYSVVVALLISLAIYNAVVLFGAKAEVGKLNASITAEQTIVESLKEEYDLLASENSVKSRLVNSNSELRYATEGEIVKISIENAGSMTEYEVPTNWFDKVCEFISNLFD